MGESKTIPNCPCCMRKPCLDGNALEAKCQHIFTGKATGIAAINPDYFTRFDGQEFPVTLNSVYVSWWHGDVVRGVPGPFNVKITILCSTTTSGFRQWHIVLEVDVPYSPYMFGFAYVIPGFGRDCPPTGAYTLDTVPGYPETGLHPVVTIS